MKEGMMDKFQAARETHRIDFFNRKEFFDGIKTTVQHQCVSCKNWYDTQYVLLVEFPMNSLGFITCTHCA